MTTNADNARIYGSDLDSIHLAPVGTPLPATADEPLDAAFEDVGWLHSDGITETATGSKTAIRGHQGGGVVRSRMEEPGTQVKFIALESKAQTKSLRYHEKSVTTTGNTRKVRRGAGQRVQVRSAVIDIYDIDNTTIKDRIVIERLEITPDGDRVFVGSDIAGFPFVGEIVGDYDSIEVSAAVVDATWTVDIEGTPTGGTYTLTVNGYTTAPIAHNANASAVAAALNALSGVTGISGITASGTPIAITFPVPVTLEANGSALTGGTDPDVKVTP